MNFKRVGQLTNMHVSFRLAISLILCSSLTFLTSCNQGKQKASTNIIHERIDPSSIERANHNESSNNDDQVGRTGGLNRNEDHLILTKHARCRMDCRHITEAELKGILHDGKINYNKSELHAQRGPKYAVEGYLTGNQHLRVIFAPEPHAVVVITCIDLDHEWQCPSCN